MGIAKDVSHIKGATFTQSFQAKQHTAALPQTTLTPTNHTRTDAGKPDKWHIHDTQHWHNITYPWVCWSGWFRVVVFVHQSAVHVTMTVVWLALVCLLCIYVSLMNDWCVCIIVTSFNPPCQSVKWLSHKPNVNISHKMNRLQKHHSATTFLKIHHFYINALSIT